MTKETSKYSVEVIMKEVLKGQRPTMRGMYLFLWGLAYFCMGYLFLFIRETPYNIIFSSIAMTTGLVCLASSWWHKLDAMAYTLLVFCSSTLAFRELFSLEYPFNLRAAAFVMWVSLSISHFVISRWPIIYDEELQDRLLAMTKTFEEIKKERKRSDDGETI